jgi:hypothetical protein
MIIARSAIWINLRQWIGSKLSLFSSSALLGWCFYGGDLVTERCPERAKPFAAAFQDSSN